MRRTDSWPAARLGSARLGSARLEKRVKSTAMRLVKPPPHLSPVLVLRCILWLLLLSMPLGRPHRARRWTLFLTLSGRFCQGPVTGATWGSGKQRA